MYFALDLCGSPFFDLWNVMFLFFVGVGSIFIPFTPE